MLVPADCSTTRSSQRGLPGNLENLVETLDVLIKLPTACRYQFVDHRGRSSLCTFR